MTRERALTQLELDKATVSGQRGWVHARWERSDGSGGAVYAAFRPKDANTWYISDLLVSIPTAALLRDVPLARIATAANADPTIRRWIEENAAPDLKEAVRRARARPRPRLKRPAGRRLDDDFYREVAEAYRAAVAHGLQPAKTLAEDSDTPLGTVNRWIARARRDEPGFLPPATPGKVSV